MYAKTRSFARVASAAVMAGLLALPTPALAASRISVGDDDYEEAASGEGWTWDGADDMTLDGYNNGGIFHAGDLTITLSGDNTVEYIIGTSDADGDGVLTITGDGSLLIEGENWYGRPGGIENNCTSGTEYGVIIDGTTLTIAGGAIDSFGGVQILNSSVEIESDFGIPIGSVDTLHIENSHVHAVNNYKIDEANPEVSDGSFGEDAYRYRVAVEAYNGTITLVGVEGDTDTVDFTFNFRTVQTLFGPDGDVNDILLDPIPEDVTEEATATRTITYKFEDGTEAAPTATDTLSFTRAGKRNPLTDETTWDEWVAQSFDDVSSPVIEGYTATLVVVAGEPASAGDELTYEVIYVKDAEPEPAPEPEPESEPAPAPKEAVIPQTADLTVGVEGLIASLGGLLSAAGIALKRRKR